MKTEKTEILKKLAPFFRPYTVLLMLAMAAGAAGSFLNILIPGRIEQISGLIQQGIGKTIDLQAVERQGLVCGGIILAMFACSLFFNREMEKCAQRIAGDIRAALNDKINRIALIHFDRLSAGDLIARTSSDVENICIAISKSVGPLLVNIILLLGAVILMLVKCVPLGLCVLVSTAVGVLACVLISSRTIPMQEKLRGELAHMNMQIDEAVTGFQVIRAFNAENDILEAFDRANEAYTGNLKKVQFATGALTPLMVLVNNIIYVVICLAGTWMMVEGSGGVTIGVIVAYILYARMLSSPLNFFAGILSMLSATLVSSKRIVDLLETPEYADEGKTALTDVRGQVEFRGVRFGYREDREILHGFSATVRPGMKVAVVGPTGAGKTTLVNLLMRFYETNSGQILIDGTDVREIPRENLHRILGMVMQETFLFQASIRENLVYSNPTAPEEMIRDVLGKCSLTHLIDTLSDGLDTVLSDRTAVSAGQRQLLSIARTMLKDPSILILDEATASVDTRTELMIQRALDELSRDRTSFVIAHRLSTIRNADIIFVMKDGDIVETGTHDELLAKDGLYAGLYRSQFE